MEGASQSELCSESNQWPACMDQPSHQTVSPEQQLADKYVPIVMVKRQRHECDSDGEAFLPAPVEVVFDDPEVELVQAASRAVSDNDLIMTAPGIADLGEGDNSIHLDFPGQPRNPGCTYEKWFRQRMAGHDPVTYVNFATNGGRFAIQYWFWYVFNDFNNTHEGDWEMIQLIFDAHSVEEALTKEPVEVGYSQHAGGERADWTDNKLSKEGNHPIVYAASGSHASKYGSAIYLGWGENNSGFGCDDTTGPSDRIDVKTIVLPNDITQASGEIAWLQWNGRWGERQRAFYNGPGGPGIRERWRNPFPWQDSLREESIEIPDSITFGPGATSTFCTATRLASLALTRVVVYPWLVFFIIILIAFLWLVLWRYGGPTLKDAWRVYWSEPRVFATLGLMLIPIGLAANALQFAILDNPPGEQVLELFDRGPGARLAVFLTIGGLQQLLNYVVIGPSVIEAVGAIKSGRRPTFVSTYRQVFRQINTLFFAVARSLLIISVLALSVIGIPWAISRTIRWLFVTQAVLLDESGARESLEISAAVVRGRWWSTAATSVLLNFVGAAAAPTIGILFMVVASTRIRYVNLISSFIYALFVPIAVIGVTLMYYRLQGKPMAPEMRPLSNPSDHAEPGFAGATN
jgi:hypothetical protein